MEDRQAVLLLFCVGDARPEALGRRGRNRDSGESGKGSEDPDGSWILEEGEGNDGGSFERMPPLPAGVWCGPHCRGARDLRRIGSNHPGPGGSPLLGGTRDLREKRIWGGFYLRMQPRLCLLPECGRAVTTEQLTRIFLRLQDREGANNINVVTAAHFLPQVSEAIRRAKEKGLKIPVIYNSSGYEKVESLRLLEGLVDVYLPDFKYMSPDLSGHLSHAPDYPEIAKAAIREMVRQVGGLRFRQETRKTVPSGLSGTPRASQGTRSPYEEEGSENTQSSLIQRGVIVRHLLLPGHVREAKAVVRYLYETYGNKIMISMMNQYTPMDRVREDPLLGRKVTEREYRRLWEYALEIGVENGFIQEGKTAEESFIPSWDGTGIL